MQFGSSPGSLREHSHHWRSAPTSLEVLCIAFVHLFCSQIYLIKYKKAIPTIMPAHKNCLSRLSDCHLSSFAPFICTKYFTIYFTISAPTILFKTHQLDHCAIMINCLLLLSSSSKFQPGPRPQTSNPSDARNVKF